MLGAAVVLGTSFVGGAINSNLFIFNFEQALEYVHFEVIFLVTGMMIVVGVIEETGIFQWLAYQAYRLSAGRAWLLIIILMVITAVASALLDNVTTMLLMTPMTIQIALTMGIAPLSLLLPEVLASNVGGISTLIGTPTNILIGSYAGLTFNDFLRNLTPGVLLAMIVLIAYVLVYYRKQLFTQGSGLSEALLERLKESGRITQPKTRQVWHRICRDAGVFYHWRAHSPRAGSDGYHRRGGHAALGCTRRRGYVKSSGLDDADVLHRPVHPRRRYPGSRSHRHHRRWYWAGGGR
jgi:hypothetical protein